MSISDEKLEEIQADLEGTCQSIDAVLEKHEIDMDANDMEDRLLDGAHAVERCGDCEWWFRASDLEFDEERQAGVCEQCDPDLHES